MGAIQQALLGEISATRFLAENFNGPTLNSDWDGSAGTYTFKGKELITWAGKVNVTESANSTLTKSAGGVAWNAGAYSTQQVSSGAIKVEAIINNNSGGANSGVLIGISNVTDAQAGSDDSTCDFCLVAYNGTLYKQEDGTATSISTYVVGDILGVEVTAGGNVNYLKNGLILSTHTSPTLNYPLCVDCSIRSTTGELGNCQIQTPGTTASIIDLTAGRIKSVRTNLNFQYKTITMEVASAATGDFYLVVGDVAGNAYLIEIRYTPSLSKLRLTQHTTAGGDVHTDYSYSLISDCRFIQLDHSFADGLFRLKTSTDGVTFTTRASTTPAGVFDFANCQIDIPITSGSNVQWNSFDSNIVA